MKKLPYFTLLFLILMNFSCSRKKYQIYIDSNSSSELLRCLNNSEKPLSNNPGFKSVQIIPLETNMDCLLAGVKDLKFTDSLIAILDYSEKIFLFNYRGEFVSSIDRRGPGPHEYTEISSFYIDEEIDCISIINYGKGTIIDYDYMGNYTSLKKFPVESFKHSYSSLLTNDNKLLLYHYLDMEDNMACSLYDMTDKEFIDKYYSFNPIILNNYLYPFAGKPMVSIGDEIHFITPLCDTIYSYSSGIFSAKYIIETPLPKAKREQIELNTTSYTAEIFNLGQRGFFTGFTGIYETNSKIMLDYKYEGLLNAYFLLDKKKNEGYHYLYEYDETISDIPFFSIISSHNDLLIGITSADYLLDLDFDLDKLKVKNKLFVDVVNNIKEDDNPVLYLYGF